MTTPEKWTIIYFPKNNLYKVFGTWTGNYLKGDSWRLNSGIEKTTQDKKYYYFHGYSGSIYKCHKKMYGVASTYGQGILYSIIEKTNANVLKKEEVYNLYSSIDRK